jgi:hypothetical protein
MFGGTDGRVILSANDPFTPPDATKPSWMLYLDPNGDTIIAHRLANAASGATTNQFVCRADGKTVCTLADGSVTGPMLVPGATLRAAAAASLTANFNTNNVTNTLITAGSVTLTTSGGMVLVAVSGGLTYAGAGGGAPYIALFRDAAQLTVYQVIPAASTGGTLALPLPNISVLEQSPAGTHVYTVKVQTSSTNFNITTSGTPGAIYAAEFC